MVSRIFTTFYRSVPSPAGGFPFVKDTVGGAMGPAVLSYKTGTHDFLT